MTIEHHQTIRYRFARSDGRIAMLQAIGSKAPLSDPGIAFGGSVRLDLAQVQTDAGICAKKSVTSTLRNCHKNPLGGRYSTRTTLSCNMLASIQDAQDAN